MSEFQSILDRHVSSCFNWKRVHRKSNDSPWLTDGLRSWIKKRLAVFRAEGRSARWKRLDTSIKQSIMSRKSKYFDSETERIKKAGKNGSWYNVLSRIVDDDAPKLWSLSDLEPDKAPEQLAEDLAVHFTEITNQSESLQDIPLSLVPDVLLPQLVEENVAKRIKEYKKPNSSVPGDIPKSLVNPVADIIAIPLTLIYNVCLAHTRWPSIWKREIVIAIPKTQTPKDYNDLRVRF